MSVYLNSVVDCLFSSSVQCCTISSDYCICEEKGAPHSAPLIKRIQLQQFELRSGVERHNCRTLLSDLYHLAVAQGLFARHDCQLCWLDAGDNLDIGAVIEAGLHRRFSNL